MPHRTEQNRTEQNGESPSASTRASQAVQRDRPLSHLLPVLEAIGAFEATCASAELILRRRADPLPDDLLVQEMTAAFWRIWHTLSLQPNTDLGGATSNFTDRESIKLRLLPVLGRSRLFWRSILKPHGYPGDYMMLEWMYDLEGGAGVDPYQPAFVNALDRVYASIHSVEAVWERRRWLTDLITQHLDATPNASLLDIACGGARYIADALRTTRTLPSRILLIDNDPSAIAFARKALEPWSDLIETASIPLKQLPVLLRERDYSHSFAISAGLFDYLSDRTASALVRGIASALREGGQIAITNFHPQDPSQLTKSWLGWDIVYRDEGQTTSLFPSEMKVSTTMSQNQSLVMALGSKTLLIEGPA
jgi:SAM-dependent methyltransferase